MRKRSDAESNVGAEGGEVSRFRKTGRAKGTSKSGGHEEGDLPFFKRLYNPSVIYRYE